MKKSLILLVLAFVFASAKAQDRQYSLMYAHPLNFTPAMAGLIEGVARGNASHSIRRFTENNQFNTTMLSADYAVNTRWAEGGVGVMFANDLSAAVRTNQMQFAFSYEVPLGSKILYHKLRAGFQAGFIQRSLQAPDLLFEDQYDGVSFSRPTQEQFDQMTIIQPDVSVGLLWYRAQKIVGNPEFNHYLGASIQHLNRPNIGFYNENGEKLSMRYTFYGGGRMRTRTGLDFNLGLFFMMQNNSYVFSSNFGVRYMLYQGGETFGYETFGFTLGANVIWGHNAIPYIGVQWKKQYALCFSYDILTNTNRIIDNNYGGLQVTLSVTFGFLKYEKSALPFPIY